MMMVVALRPLRRLAALLQRVHVSRLAGLLELLGKRSQKLGLGSCRLARLGLQRLGDLGGRAWNSLGLD